jgi:hypothetical protein
MPHPQPKTTETEIVQNGFPTALPELETGYGDYRGPANHLIAMLASAVHEENVFDRVAGVPDSSLGFRVGSIIALCAGSAGLWIAGVILIRAFLHGVSF